MVEEVAKIVGELEALGLTTDEEGIVEKGRPWSDLMCELLVEICSRLFVGGRVAFSSVCKSWKSSSVFPSRRLQLPINSSGCKSPCLVYSNNKGSHQINTIHHPMYDEWGHISVEFKYGTQICAANNDWLLISECRQKLFFLNPFTKTKIEIPNFPHLDTRSMCFTSLPTSTNWEIVAGAVTGGQVAICSIKCGDKNWSSFDYAMDFEFSFCKSVIHKGSHYFLDMDANVLIYNHKSKTANFYMASENLNAKIYASKGQHYLVENEGTLMAVFVGADGSWIQICMWEDDEKSWKIVPSLGNKTLFVGRALSLCEEASAGGTCNTIYFSRIVDGHCLFYSLSTKKYYAFGSGSYDNFYAAKFPTGTVATWVKP